MRIKICGLTDYRDAALAASLGADLLGFIFAESPRRVAPQDAARIISRLRREGLLRRARPVGVFVNTPVGEMEQLRRRCGLELLQVHGDETPEECARIPALWYRALRVSDIEDWRAAAPQQGKRWTTPLLLVDAAVKGVYGGTGKQVPADLAAAICQEVKRAGKSFFLAGGLKPDLQLLQLIRRVAPDGIDVSSGLEREPGRKDEAKLRRLFELVN